MRLIDADWVQKRLRDYYGFDSKEPYGGISTDGIAALSVIDNALTVEVEPVRHDGWISVEDRLPEEHDSIFAKFYGTPKWEKYMFSKTSNKVIVCYMCANGTNIVREGQTYDGRWLSVERDLDIIWHGRVTHWMPMPEPPKED